MLNNLCGFVFLGKTLTIHLQKIYGYYQRGSKNVLSGHLGQVDFLAGQISFHSHLPNKQSKKSKKVKK